jgi:ligand-binding sensor domain-containing protein
MRKSSLIIFILLSAVTSMSQTNWKRYDVINSPLISDFTQEIKEDIDGLLWIATQEGLVKFDKVNTWQIYTESNSNMYDHNISSVLPLGNNTCWLGHVGGVSYFDGTTFTHYDFDGMFSSYWQGANTINQIDKDWNGNIWFATSEGLIKYDGNTFTRLTTQNGLHSNEIWSVKCDLIKNIIWIGTYDEGLIAYDGSIFTRYFLYDTAGPFAVLQQVNEIFIDTDGDIWLTGYGIFEFDKDSMGIKSYYVSEINEALFWGLNIDQNNKMWIGSDYLHGLFMYDQTNWFTYDSINSIIPDHCLNCSVPCNHIESIYVDADNTKWMASWKSIIVYNENGISGITDYKVNKINLAVFPNPVSSKLNIKTDVNNPYYRVIDIKGRVLLESNLNSIDVSSYSSGTFYLQVFENNTFIATEKFIVN